MAAETETIRAAGAGDAPVLARLLHDFNTEYDEPTPSVEFLAKRIGELLAAEEIGALLVGEPPCGMAIYRYRPSLWGDGLDAYLEELYVAPGQRGEGRGRALMGRVLETARSAGAEHIELNTGETDREARGLYESLGFTNREGSPDGPTMLYYELDL